MSDADNPQGPAPDPRDVELARLRKEILDNRRYVNSRDEELKALRQQLQARNQPAFQPAYEEPEEPAPYDGGGRFDSEQRKQREMQRDFELAETRFLVKNPEAAKKWAKVDEVVQKMKTDPYLASEYVSRDENGDINWNKMFKDIYKDIELAELKAVRTTPASASATPSIPPGAHTISGGVTTPQESGTFDLKNATADEILAEMQKAGLVNPEDPISTPRTSLR